MMMEISNPLETARQLVGQLERRQTTTQAPVPWQI
jgi:hypothetical protein